MNGQRKRTFTLANKVTPKHLRILLAIENGDWGSIIIRPAQLFWNDRLGVAGIEPNSDRDHEMPLSERLINDEAFLELCEWRFFHLDEDSDDDNPIYTLNAYIWDRQRDGMEFLA